MRWSIFVNISRLGHSHTHHYISLGVWDEISEIKIPIASQYKDIEIQVCVKMVLKRGLVSSEAELASTTTSWYAGDCLNITQVETLTSGFTLFFIFVL